jgi:diguanylate cyclase (GGDEF)-like protein
MALACLIILVMTPFQIYQGFILGDFPMARGFVMVGSATGYVLIGIGFLTSILIEQHKVLESLALRDPLTGLLNRRGMDVALGVTLAAGKRHSRDISIIALDIDHFKSVNDDYGHDAGDAVLKQFGYLVSQVSRESDICCRYGGEEFLVILPETTTQQAKDIAERLRVLIEDSDWLVKNKSLPITASMGVATQRGDINIDGLIKDADTMLYKAKAEGRNRVCVMDSPVS